MFTVQLIVEILDTDHERNFDEIVASVKKELPFQLKKLNNTDLQSKNDFALNNVLNLSLPAVLDSSIRRFKPDFVRQS